MLGLYFLFGNRVSMLISSTMSVLMLHCSRLMFKKKICCKGSYFDRVFYQAWPFIVCPVLYLSLTLPKGWIRRLFPFRKSGGWGEIR